MKNRILVYVIAFFALIAYSHKIYGQVVDTNFAPVVKGSPGVSEIVVQLDGKVLIAGEISLIGESVVYGIARLNADGTRDESFNTIDLGYGTIYDIFYDADSDKIYIGGKFEGQNDIIKLNYDGSIDDTFNVSAELSYVSGIEKQSDGSLIVMSFTLGNNLIKIDSNGNIDENFGFNQILFAGSVSDNDMKVLANDKIAIVADYLQIDNVEYNKLIVLNADGSIDDNFDIGSGPFSASYYSLKSINEMLDGDLLVTGNFSSFNGISVSGVVKLNPDGSLDGSFPLPGPAGTTLTNDIIGKLDQNGNILLSGWVYESNYKYKVIRLNADGTNDDTFATVDLDISNHERFITDPTISVNSSNEIYVAGIHATCNGNTQYGLGKIDNSGNAVSAYNANIGGDATIYTSLLLDNGQIIIGGNFIGVGNDDASFLAMINSDGSLDNTFHMNMGVGPNRKVNSIVQNIDGSFIIGGAFSEFNDNYTGTLVKLDATGSFDATFDPKVQVKNVGSGVNKIMLQSDGKIIVGGLFDYVDNTQKHSIARLNADGTIDNTYNSANVLISTSRILDIEFQSDGKALIGGRIGSSGGVLMRLDVEGNVDAGFDTNYELGDFNINEIAVNSDDSFLVGGYIISEYSVNLRQFEKDGIINDDASISVGGVSWASVRTIETIDPITSYIGGSFTDVNNVQAYSLAKVGASGSVDQNYNYHFTASGRYSSAIVNGIHLIDENTMLVHGAFSKLENQSVFGIAKINLMAPLAPTNLNVSFDYQNGVEMYWTDNSTINSGGFELYRSVDNGEFEIIAITTDDESFYDDANVELGQLYTYKVRAKSDSHYSEYSGEMSITPDALPIVDGLEADFDFVKGVILSWIDNSSTEDGYEIFVSTDNITYNLLTTETSNTTDIEDFNVALGTEYFYKVKLIQGLFESEYSEILAYTTPVSALLTAPSNLNVELNNSKINISWEDINTNILGFEIYKSIGTNEDFEMLSSQTQLVYSDQSISEGLTYFYKVRAYNSFEYSDFSDVQNYLITGMDNSLSDKEVHIYPNPSTGKVSVNYSSQDIDSYSILDTKGQILDKGYITSTSTRFEYDLSNYPTGVYYIIISTDSGEIESHRLIRE